MAGKANRTSFKPGDKRAGRPPGRSSFMTLLMETIREESMIEATPDMDNRATQKLFIKYVAQRAFNANDKDSAMLLKEMISRSYPSMKPAMSTINFELDEDLSPVEQSKQIMTAVSNGEIAPDVAQMLIGNLASMLKIEEITEIAERLKEVEEALGVANG